MGEQLDWSEIGTRLRQARMAAGLSQEQLGRAVGLERTMVVKAESGSRRLDALELSRIAAALDMPLAHFLTMGPEVLSRRTELTDDADTDTDRNAYLLEAELASWLRDIRQLVGLGVLTLSEPKRYPGKVADKDGARAAAAWLRAELGVGGQPLGPLIQESERAGQLILIADSPGVGASVLDNDVAVCVVSERQDPGRRRSTAAHELGHLVIGDEYSADFGVHSSRDEREQAVDAFAAEFLLPTASIQEGWRPASTSLRDIRSELVRLAAQYRVSWTMALRQAEHARVIDNRSPFTANKPTRAELKDATGWAPEPDLEGYRVPPSVATAVMAAWRKELITPSRAEGLTRGQILASELTSAADECEKP